MVTSIYKCPITGLMVQGWFSEEDAQRHAKTYEGFTCPVCRQVHFVNLRTREVLDRGPVRSCYMKDQK